MAFKGFQRLNETLGKLAEVPSRAARDASESIATLIGENFDAGTDPYGREWAPLAPYTIAKGREPPPLTDTGAMRESVSVKPTSGSGIEVSIDSEYATYHQTGTVNMPQRQIMPQSGGLAPAWSNAIKDAVADNIKKAMK